MEQKLSIRLWASLGWLSLVLVFGFGLGGGLEQQTQKQMTRIEQQVAADAVKQYEIAKRNGSAMDAYVQASLVAAAYLQAKDEANYQAWKKSEQEEAGRAGIPLPP